MGTNFYLHEKEQPPCPTCGHPPPKRFDELHIGKNSAGWCFSLHVWEPDDCLESDDPPFPQNLDDWKKLFADERFEIRNEYGEVLTAEQMLDWITKKSWPQRDETQPPPQGYLSWENCYRSNHVIHGPNNLLRHEPGGRCIGNGGDETYDLITGYFS